MVLMRFIKWTLEFMAMSAFVLGLTWLILEAFDPLTSFLLQFLYGEDSMSILAIKVIGIGVIIGLIAWLLYSAVRAAFNRSR